MAPTILAGASYSDRMSAWRKLVQHTRTPDSRVEAGVGGPLRGIYVALLLEQVPSAWMLSHYLM